MDEEASLLALLLGSETVEVSSATSVGEGLTLLAEGVVEVLIRVGLAWSGILSGAANVLHRLTWLSWSGDGGWLLLWLLLWLFSGDDVDLLGFWSRGELLNVLWWRWWGSSGRLVVRSDVLAEDGALLERVEVVGVSETSSPPEGDAVLL